MSNSKRDYLQVILIGPARSGTKIIRETIATHPSVNQIGFDINFIWKRHNEKIAHDALSPELATDKVVDYINRYFESKAKNADFLIEKTVSNTLRIPFVKKILPDAKYIFLFRNGVDTVESVSRQWGVSPGGKYLLQKFFSVPVIDVIPYVSKYAVDLIRIKLKRSTSDSYVWGVRYPGCEKDLKEKSLLEFCALQWNYSANAMLDYLENEPAEDYLILRYEDFVENPTQELKKISEYLDLPDHSFETTQIYNKSVGHSRKNLSDEEYRNVMKIIEHNMKRLNYPVE